MSATVVLIAAISVDTAFLRARQHYLNLKGKEQRPDQGSVS